MSGFHIIISLVRANYSQFHNPGLIQCTAEASIGSDCSIKSAMKGSNVKFGVRWYKILFQAVFLFEIRMPDGQSFS